MAGAEATYDTGYFADSYFDYENDDIALQKELEIVDALEDGSMFEDEIFPPDGSSLYVDPFQPPRGALPADVVEWKRINENTIRGCTEPYTYHMNDQPYGAVVQGALANRWFIGALTVLATQPKMVRATIVSEEFRDKGIYTLKFFKAGKWRYVHIDDRIPCNKAGDVHFARNADPNEMWAVVIEKAFAKLHGCYEAIEHGTVDYALSNLTGTGTSQLDLRSPKFQRMLSNDKLWTDLLALFKAGTLIGCERTVKKLASHGNADAGIVAGHAYAVVDMVVAKAAATEDFDALEQRMVRVSDGWGLGKWSGRWNDDDPIWDDYPEIRDALRPPDHHHHHRHHHHHHHHHKEVMDAAEQPEGKEGKEEEKGAEEVEDGVLRPVDVAERSHQPGGTTGFWVVWEDFVSVFTKLYTATPVHNPQASTQYKGVWREGDSKSALGGVPPFPAFEANPCYTVALQEPAPLQITLTQRDSRWQDGEKVRSKACIGFIVVKLARRKFRISHFHPRKLVCNSPVFAAHHAVSAVVSLPPGRFAIIPCVANASELMQEANDAFEDAPKAEGEERPPVSVQYFLRLASPEPVNFEQETNKVPDVAGLQDSDDEGLGPPNMEDPTVFDDEGPQSAEHDPEDEYMAMAELQRQVASLANYIFDLQSDIAQTKMQVAEMEKLV